MSEQRFVVEVARPVPAAEVDAVAALVAERLRIDAGRIRTLLDGRTGPVTRAIRADKADAIARVFADAGVEVYVVADIEPAAGQHSYGPLGPGQPDGDEPESAGADIDERPGPPLTWEPESWAAAGDGGRHAEGPWVPEADEETWRMPIVPAGAAEIAAEVAEDAADAHEVDDEGDDLEEEADRLGPSAARSAVDGAFLTSTRWVPSPHEAESISVEDDRGRGGFGRDAQGDAAGGVAVGSSGGRSVGRTRDDDRWWIPRSAVEADYASEAPPPERPKLRVYLLLALVVSLLVLIVLQVVNAGGGARSDLAAFDAGMRAYREGDFVAARRTWEPLSERGDARAAYYLGHMAEHGLGQSWSNARAARFYRRAADAGLPEAQVALAELYIRGMGVDQDASVAVELYRAAARDGYGPALYALGLSYVHGTGVPRDFDAALTALDAAAQRGVQEAADIVDFVRAIGEPADAAASP